MARTPSGSSKDDSSTDQTVAEQTVTELPDGPADATGLTPRQRRVLDVIRDSVDRRGYPPSMREIGTAFGIASPNGVMANLRALQAKGVLKADAVSARTWVPVGYVVVRQDELERLRREAERNAGATT